MLRILSVCLPLALLGCGDGDKTDATDGGLTTTTSTTSGNGTSTTSTTSTTGDCVPDSVPTPTGDAATVDLGGECPLATKQGSFVVSVFEEFSIVDGDYASGVVPITVLEEVGAEGGCILKRRNNPFCDPACEPNETCDFDGSCIPFPLNQDLGTVTVGGLEKDVIMTPLGDSFNYFDTQLPHPVFVPGALIELQTGECGVPDIVTLHGVGVEPIVLVNGDWVIDRDTDLTFQWVPPTADPVRSQVHMRLNIDQHGVTPVQLFCEFDDDGEATVPMSLINQLMDFGVTGFPNATVTRRTVDSTTASSGGCVEFIVSSPTDPSVDVAGFIPCVTDVDCLPYGLQCNEPIGLCE